MNITKKAELRRLLGPAITDQELDALIARGVGATVAAAKAAGQVTFKAPATLDDIPAAVAEMTDAEVDAFLNALIRGMSRAELDSLIRALQTMAPGAQADKVSDGGPAPGAYPMGDQDRAAQIAAIQRKIADAGQQLARVKAAQQPGPAGTVAAILAPPVRPRRRLKAGGEATAARIVDNAIDRITRML